MGFAEQAVVANAWISIFYLLKFGSPEPSKPCDSSAHDCQRHLNLTAYCTCPIALGRVLIELCFFELVTQH